MVDERWNRCAGPIGVDEPGAEEQMLAQERTRAVSAVVSALPPLLAEAVWLRYFEELTEREMVQRLNVPAGTVKSRLHHGLKRLPDGSLAWKYDKALREMMRGGGRRADMDLWAPLARITCPTLIVRGAESDILSPEIAKRMIETLPDGRLVEVASAGHTVPGDQPDAFARAVRSFLGI
jgi:pimeloyl-ACP methyl ester carboxylesterase